VHKSYDPSCNCNATDYTFTQFVKSSVWPVYGGQLIFEWRGNATTIVRVLLCWWLLLFAVTAAVAHVTKRRHAYPAVWRWLHLRVFGCLRVRRLATLQSFSRAEALMLFWLGGYLSLVSSASIHGVTPSRLAL
jgi:hypothetical protein